MTERSTFLKRAIFFVVFATVVAFALADAAWLNIHELGTILLFVPLIWAFMTLTPKGMLISGVILACARFTVELLGIWNRQHDWDLPGAIVESVWPIALYVAFGFVLYAYRKRQKELVASLLNVVTIEARHRIASSLTHDFNNILTVIIGTGELLFRSPDLLPEHRKDVESMIMAGREGVSLIEQFRIATRGGEQHLESMEFSSLIDNQAGLINRILPANIHVLRHSGENMLVKADKSQILRVLMNLCLNARDAMPNGGILTIQTEKKIIMGRDYACLIVSDTGPGIDPAIMDKIFEPFFTTRQEGGAGLGLSIVKSVALAHGGSVAACNIPGSGASFTFAIPLETQAQV